MIRFVNFIFTTFIFVTFPISAHAAVLLIVPEANEIGVGQEVKASVVINTEEVAINAAQATVTFPPETLKVVSIDFITSIFNFWVEEPEYNNETGTVMFVGGTAKGVTGEGLTVATITFKSLGSGPASVSAKDAVVTASDGKGTNVLSAIEGASILVGVSTYVPEPEFDPTTVVVEAVKKVTRQAVVASGFPAAPIISVPLYPDPLKWYKHQGAVTAFWEIPDDVIKVAVDVDNNPNTEPSNSEDGLFTGKEFGTFDEGETYIHVQFKNNIGWGPVSHYRVAIDTEPPTPFSIEFDGALGDDPTPTLFIDSFDALSGIDKLVISIDDQKSLEFASTTITLPPQKPGTHSMTVRVLDRARNSVENSIMFEIDPLPTPTISFVARSISQSEEGFLSGNSIPGGFVDVQLFNKDGSEVLSGVAATDEVGNWRFVFGEILPTGKYTITVTARDQRGAVSYPTEPENLRVTAKVILSLGFIDLGWFEILIILVLIGASVGGFAAWYYVKEQDTQSAYAIIAARDVKKFGDLLLSQLKIIENASEAQNKGRKSKGVIQLQGEIDHAAAQIKDTISKMNKYLVDLINKA